jgi:hypothetical protein
MPDRLQRAGAQAAQSVSTFMAPGAALSMWNPFLAGAFDGNTQALEEINRITGEWRDFVSHRLKEDVALLQRLTRSNTPDEIVAAYADFWSKAGEDYGKEVTTMTKLMVDVTSKMMVAAQSATEDANKRLSQREAA